MTGLRPPSAEGPSRPFVLSVLCQHLEPRKLRRRPARSRATEPPDAEHGRGDGERRPAHTGDEVHVLGFTPREFVLFGLPCRNPRNAWLPSSLGRFPRVKSEASDD